MESTYFIDSANIREVIAGDPKNGIRYFIGGEYTVDKKNNPVRLIITGIVLDENYISNYGITRALIFASKDDGKEEFLWKILEGIPMIITCNI